MVVPGFLSRLLRRAGWLVGGLFAVAFALVIVAGGLLLGANTDPGRAFIARAVSGLTGGAGSAFRPRRPFSR